MAACRSRQAPAAATIMCCTASSTTAHRRRAARRAQGHPEKAQQVVRGTPGEHGQSRRRRLPRPAGCHARDQISDPSFCKPEVHCDPQCASGFVFAKAKRAASDRAARCRFLRNAGSHPLPVEHIVAGGGIAGQGREHAAQHTVLVADALLCQAGDAIACFVPADDGIIIFIGRFPFISYSGAYRRPSATARWCSARVSCRSTCRQGRVSSLRVNRQVGAGGKGKLSGWNHSGG